MNSRYTLHCAWAVLAVAAYFAGSLRDAPPGMAGSAGAGARPDAQARSRSAAGSSEETYASTGNLVAPREDLAALPPDQMKARFFAALSEPIRWKRMLQVMQLFEGMTAENRNAITDAFIRQTKAEGRTHSLEWELLKERVGEVGGREELEAVLATGGPNRMRHAAMNLKGWAGVNPAAAREWFASKDAETQKALAGAFLSGLARAQPRDAALFSLTLPDRVAGQAAAPMVDEIFQSGGTQAAADVLAALRAREDLPIERRRVISYHIGQKIRYAGAIQNDPARALNWAAGHLGPNSMVGPGLLNELLTDAASRDPVAATRWMDTHGANLAEDQAQAGYRALGSILQSGQQNELDQWLTKNPTHPNRDDVLSAAAANAFRQGKIAEVEKFNAAIQDPKKHVPLERIQREQQTEGDASRP